MRGGIGAMPLRSIAPYVSGRGRREVGAGPPKRGHAGDIVDSVGGGAPAQPRRLAPAARGLCCGRRLGAGDGAVLSVAGALDHAAGAGVADRREPSAATPNSRRPGAGAPACGGGRDRLVVGVRLLPGRPALDRRGVPGRGGGLRRLHALCRHADAGRPGAVLRCGHGGGSDGLEVRRLARRRARAFAVGHGMAARPRADGLPLERAGLRAHLSGRADAERRGARHLRADAGRRPGVRPARGPVERGRCRARAPQMGGAGRGPAPAARRRRAGPRPARLRRGRHGPRRQDQDRAAERAAAGEMAPGELGALLPGPPRSFRAQSGRRHRRPRRASHMSSGPRQRCRSRPWTPRRR